MVLQNLLLLYDTSLIQSTLLHFKGSWYFICKGSGKKLILQKIMIVVMCVILCFVVYCNTRAKYVRCIARYLCILNLCCSTLTEYVINVSKYLYVLYAFANPKGLTWHVDFMRGTSHDHIFLTLWGYPRGVILVITWCRWVGGAAIHVCRRTVRVLWEVRIPF